MLDAELALHTLARVLDSTAVKVLSSKRYLASNSYDRGSLVGALLA